MLNFRNTNIIFGTILFVLIYCDVLYTNIEWWLYALLLLVYLFIQFLGSYFVCSQFYMKVICKAKIQQKKIALTFDDGPAENCTSSILDTLQQHHVSACFFCIGEKIGHRPDLLKRIHEEGHLIGNHSFTHHTWFDLFSVKRMQKEMQQTNDLVRQYLGLELKWFRPPYGVTNPSLAIAVKKMGFTAIGWSIRSYDTMYRDADKLLQKMKKTLKPGAVILFHDRCEPTAAMLSSFLEFVKDEGYEIERLDKLLHLQGKGYN